MRKYLLISAFLVSLLGYSQADDILATVEWADPMPKQMVSIVHSDSDFVFYAGIKKTGFLSYDQVFGRMDKFTLDKDLEVVKDADKYKGEYPTSLGYKVRNNELHGFFEHYDKKADRHTLLVRKLLDERRKMGPYKVLASLPSKRRSKGDLTYTWSENDSLLMIIGNPPVKKKTDTEKVIFTVLDMGYEKIFEAEIELEFADRYFSITDYEITNKGDILMMGYKTPNKKKGEKKERKGTNRKYYLYVLDQETEELIEYDLGLEDKFVSNIDLSVDFENNTAALYGVYGDSEYGSVVGTFYISIDQSTYDVQNSKFNEFDKEFKVLMATSKRKAKKIKKGKEAEIENLRVKLRNVIRKEDGGHLVVFEEYYFYVTSSTDANGNTSYTYHYHYEDIFVQNYTSEGDVVWTAYLPKEQRTTNDEGKYSGFLLVVDQNRLHFIYNDNPKNQERWGTDEELKNLGSLKKANLVMVSLTEEGDLTYNILMPTRTDKFYICPRKSRMTGRNSNTGILTSYKKSDTRFGILELFFE